MILELAEHNLRTDTAGSSLQKSLETSKGIQVCHSSARETIFAARVW